MSCWPGFRTLPLLYMPGSGSVREHGVVTTETHTQQGWKSKGGGFLCGSAVVNSWFTAWKSLSTYFKSDTCMTSATSLWRGKCLCIVSFNLSVCSIDDTNSGLVAFWLLIYQYKIRPVWFLISSVYYFPSFEKENVTCFLSPSVVVNAVPLK